MKYDFETRVNRCNQGAVKWRQMKDKNPSVLDKIVPLSVADMEFKNAPEIVSGLTRVLEESVLGYACPKDSYYKAVIDWMKHRHGWSIEKEWIITCPGVKTALNSLVAEFLNPEEGVVIMTPVYPPFYKVVTDNGCIVEENPLKIVDGHYQIDFLDLEEKLKKETTKAIILCSPHNPVGRVWTVEELTQIMELCIKYDILVINDEIHHDLIMPGFKHTPLASIKPEYQDLVITCTSVSKSFNLAGLNGANIIIKNPERRKAFENRLAILGIKSLNALAYPAVEIAYTECEEWLNQVIEVIHGNYNLVKYFMGKHFPEVIVYPLEGTYLLWMNLCPYCTDCQELEEFMIQKAQWFTNEGYAFGKAGAGFERINLACPTKVLEEALERLLTAYQKNNNSFKKDSV